MKSSIKIRLAVTFIGIMLLALLSIGLMNRFFLERFYVSKKTESIDEVFQALNKGEYGSKIKGETLKSFCIEKNISWIVINTQSSEILSSDGRDAELLYGRLQFGYLGGRVPSNRVIIEETEKYTMEKNRDDFQDTDYLDMWGVLDNENAFLIRTPIASIKDSAQISNVFYWYIGIATILISGGVIWFFSRRMMRPLLKLTEISRRMIDLDFDARYEDGRKDEFSVLGHNFNRMSEELEQKISELKTANNELQEDIEEKRQIDEMRKEFLSNVSHELKTPIALIQGYAEGLKECINDDEESREFYCDVIMDEASKMNQMVKKLLTLNQLESGNDQVMMARFDLTDLVKGAVQSAGLLASQKAAEIDFHQIEPVYVWGDEFKVEEVVTNYVSNAINHVEGEKKIEVKMVKKKEVVRLSVFNTGSPIPEKDLENIWIKFYKVDKARTREYGGNGIGLSIVKAIMESMHQNFGVINYENGVEFWFELELS